MTGKTRSAWVAAALLALGPHAVILAAAPAQSTPEAAVPTEFSRDRAQGLLDRYCLTCHNSTANTAGLALDTKDAEIVGPDAEVWESVVRKIRTGLMPPGEAPRPIRRDLDGLASWLEAGLDRAAASAPNPGSPTLHRLNRTEYANAIRDLLDLEIDASTLLPVDSSAAGFDNVADVLSTSPALIEGYLSAAMKVSRLAVGDLTAPPRIVTHRAPDDLSQTGHIEGLPLGTRGGMVVRHVFPLDAEYEFAVGGGGPDLDFTIDGESVPAGDRGGIVRQVSAGPHTLAASLVRTLRSVGVDDTFSAPLSNRGGIQSITVTGPLDPTGPGDTPSRRRIFACQPEGAEDELRCARDILGALARRAFRRPVPNDDPVMTTLVEFYEAGRGEGTFETGIQHALARILVDPRFIFRMEHVPGELAVGAVYPLTDIEIASRLSFFLWSSIPDDELLEVAASGMLSDPATLEEQTLRMLANPRSQALIDNFAAQWMGLRELEDAAPESDGFDANLRMAFERETRRLFEHIVNEDRSIVELLDADYTFLDQRLAEHYGIPGVRGSRVRRVALDPDSPRRGILGHGSILLVTSVANRTSPVVRGKWVLENLLGAPPPSPPAGVETNLDETPDAVASGTLRERLEQHRANPACASCHGIMDPIGFSLENFDLTGRWREYDGDAPIDASSKLADGTVLDGPASLRRALLLRSDAFVSTAVEKLLTYATGRAAEYYDMPAIRSIVRGAAASDYRFSSLVLGIVASPPFQTRVKAVERNDTVAEAELAVEVPGQD